MKKLVFILLSVFLNVFDLLSVSMEFTSHFSCFCTLKECGPRRICKSRGAGCFSDLINDSDVRTAQHGCLDLLSEEKQSQCQNVPGVAISSMGQRSLLLCCQKDMCNLDPEHYLMLNQTTSLELPVNQLYANQHIWYRVATIAVPICGVLILGMLILVGAKILKSDNFDERILMSKLREKHEQCTSSLNSGSLNIVPLLPPRHPLLGVGVNINKLDHVVHMHGVERGLHVFPCSDTSSIRTVNNMTGTVSHPGGSLRGVISNVPNVHLSTATSTEESSRSNKNCNTGVPSDIIKDLEILDKPSASTIPSCNIYSSPIRTGYDPKVNSQVTVTDKINYKQSLISSWMNQEREPDT
uniref:BMP and activin membrane-bound inhibitor homolog n=1 Tax=Cacopsylla melanoneura TaxID=428564 RepID=A0A8D8ZZM0_9HEMI